MPCWIVLVIVYRDTSYNRMIQLSTHAAWYGLGPRPIELAIFSYKNRYAVTFYNIKYSPPDRDLGGVLLFSSMSTQLG